MSELGALRDMSPLRPLTLLEAQRVAELQAARLLRLLGVTQPPVPESAIADLDRIEVRKVKSLPASGATEWVGNRWLIVLNASEAAVRQRFSLAHEFKHVVDNPFVRLLYPPQQGVSARQRRELAADYFAASLLMPKPWVKQAWGRGVQDVAELAGLFDVSAVAMNYRLTQIGLVRPAPRCSLAA